MRRLMHSIHTRPALTRNELVADAIFLAVSALISFLAIFIFDIHGSFYPQNSIFAPKFIFKSSEPYFFAVPLGALVGFFLFKIVIYGVMLEEEEMGKGLKKR